MYKIDIGKTLKQLRVREGISQGDIYRSSGIERSTISRIESGVIKEPSIKTMIKICKALGIKVSEFIELAETNDER